MVREDRRPVYEWVEKPWRASASVEKFFKWYQGREEVKAEKDLGLLVSENLGWDKYISGRVLKMRIGVLDGYHEIW